MHSEKMHDIHLRFFFKNLDFKEASKTWHPYKKSTRKDEETDINCIKYMKIVGLFVCLFVIVFFFFFFCVPQLYLWGSPLWVRFLRM